MEKKMLSAVVIMTTLISSGVMVFESGFMPYNEVVNEKRYNKNAVIIHKDSADSLVKNNETLQNKDLKKGNKISDGSNNDLQKRNDINISDEAVENDEGDSGYQEAEIVDETNTTDKYSINTDETNINALEILKIPMEKIEKNLSLLDKARLISLRTKISSKDYARINNYLQGENQIEGIVKTISLLKMRLSRRDYEKLRKVATKYIDMDKVETLMASSK